jgi:cholera toxin transcriptional activator
MQPVGKRHIIRFEDFEIDVRTRELRRNNKPIRLQDLPTRLLILLATRAGELVTREEIERELWGDEHFVDFEHGINTAMRKVREALDENLDNPKFIETLPRKGYRFIASVQPGALDPEGSDSSDCRSATKQSAEAPASADSYASGAIESARTEIEQASRGPQGPTVAESPDFAVPTAPARKLFLITQAGYLAMYCALLFKLDDAGRVLNVLIGLTAAKSIPLLIALAVSGVAIRLFLLTSVGLNHPQAGIKYRRLYPIVLLLDMVWAASPLLLFEKIGMGLAMASLAGLAYLPFSQRILMSSIYPTD